VVVVLIKIYFFSYKMLLGQDNYVQIYDDKKYSILLKNIKGRTEDIIIDDSNYTDILAIKNHKKYRVLIRLIFENGTQVDLGKETMLQVVEGHDSAKLIPAKAVKPGQRVCPPIPPYADPAKASGFIIMFKETRMLLASTVIFGKCDYVLINGIPILHDNEEDKNIRKVARRSNSLANLLLKI
jgi:hypothetical protein